VGGNTNLQGRVFEIRVKDAVHQCAETVKAITDYVGQEYMHFKIAKRFKSVRYDNTTKDAFVITRDDRSNMKFRPSDTGLDYYNFEESLRRKQYKLQEKDHCTIVVDTVEVKQQNFTKRELEISEVARRTYVIVGRPGKHYNTAVTIYGEDLGVLKGKMLKQKQSQVRVVLEQKPKVKQEQLILAIDLMYFTGLIILVTVWRDVHFITAMLIPDRKKSTIMGALKLTINLFRRRGHKINEMEFNVKEEEIHTILADNESQALRDDIEDLGINLNIVSKDEHVLEVERQNNVIKERARAIVQTLPYKKLPKKIRIAIIQRIVYWLNNIPKEGQESSPRDNVFGFHKLDFKTVC
jgi:hypothetical protein